MSLDLIFKSLDKIEGNLDRSTVVQREFADRLTQLEQRGSALPDDGQTPRGGTTPGDRVVKAIRRKP